MDVSRVKNCVGGIERKGKKQNKNNTNVNECVGDVRNLWGAEKRKKTTNR